MAPGAPAAPSGPKLKPKKAVKPGKKMKVFHWQVVQPGKLAETLWLKINETSEEEDITKSFNTAALEEEFGQAERRVGGGGPGGLARMGSKLKLGGLAIPLTSPMSSPMASPRGGTTENTPQFLDQNRAQNVNISIARFRMKPEAIYQGLLSMSDDLANDEDRLAAILKAAPTEEELSAVKSYDGEPEALVAPERFMFEVARLPRVRRRLELCLFRSRFDGSLKEVHDNIITYDKAVDCLLGSKHLHKVLTVVLAMGNYMNAGNKTKGGAYGFQLSTLNKLGNTKGSSGVSFLAFLTAHVKKELPDARGFIDDINPCRQAARVESTYLEGLVKKVEATVKKLEMDLKQKNENPKDKYHEVMSKFFEKAGRETAKVLEEYKQLVDKCARLQAFFAQKKDSKPEQLFDLFAQFADNYQKAEKEAERKAKANARAKQGGLAAAAASGRATLRKTPKKVRPQPAPGINLALLGGPGGAGVGDKLREQLQSGNIAAVIRARRAAKQDQPK